MDTFQGIERLMNADGLRLLRGFRLPLTENGHRERARRLATMRKPGRHEIGWLHWRMLVESARIIEQVDAESNWQNEGGR